MTGFNRAESTQRPPTAVAGGFHPLSPAIPATACPTYVPCLSSSSKCVWHQFYHFCARDGRFHTPPTAYLRVGGHGLGWGLTRDLFSFLFHNRQHYISDANIQQKNNPKNTFSQFPYTELEKGDRQPCINRKIVHAHIIWYRKSKQNRNKSKQEVREKPFIECINPFVVFGRKLYSHHIV